jgi:hypothetical protein
MAFSIAMHCWSRFVFTIFFGNDCAIQNVIHQDNSFKNRRQKYQQGNNYVREAAHEFRAKIRSFSSLIMTLLKKQMI